MNAKIIVLILSLNFSIPAYPVIKQLSSMFFKSVKNQQIISGYWNHFQKKPKNFLQNHAFCSEEANKNSKEKLIKKINSTNRKLYDLDMDLIKKKKLYPSRFGPSSDYDFYEKFINEKISDDQLLVTIAQKRILAYSDFEELRKNQYYWWLLDNVKNSARFLEEKERWQDFVKNL